MKQCRGMLPFIVGEWWDWTRMTQFFLLLANFVPVCSIASAFETSHCQVGRRETISVNLWNCKIGWRLLPSGSRSIISTPLVTRSMVIQKFWGSKLRSGCWYNVPRHQECVLPWRVIVSISKKQSFYICCLWTDPTITPFPTCPSVRAANVTDMPVIALWALEKGRRRASFVNANTSPQVTVKAWNRRIIERLIVVIQILSKTIITGLIAVLYSAL